MVKNEKKDYEQGFAAFMWMREQLYQKQLDFQDNTDEGKQLMAKIKMGLESKKAMMIEDG